MTKLATVTQIYETNARQVPKHLIDAGWLWQEYDNTWRRGDEVIRAEVISSACKAMAKYAVALEYLRGR